MSSTKKPKPTAEDVQQPGILGKALSAVKSLDPRNGLGVYLDKPETNPEGRIVEYDDDFVVITDKYPKARYILQTPSERYQADNYSACISSSSRAIQTSTTNIPCTSSPQTPPSSPTYSTE
jgi:aprataxin